MAKNKKNNKKRMDVYFEIFIAASVLVGLITFLISGVFKIGFIAFFITLIILSIGFIILCIPSVKGKIGEHKVKKGLNKVVKKHGGYVVNDLMIVDDDSKKSSQIDHIYISKYGIYVIETKNYSGRIYGKDNDDKWTQVLNYGYTKNHFYNPVKQNYTHICRLEKLLEINKTNLQSIIVFIHNNISYIESDFVYPLKKLKNIISIKDQIKYSDEEIKNFYDQLINYKGGVNLTNKEHIQEIKQMIKDVDNNICPRCGGSLVLRTGKDGSNFYGCSNFPKCRFTKKY